MTATTSTSSGVPHELLRRALRRASSFQGERSRYRGGRARGEPSGHLPPTAFVVLPAESRPDRQPRASAIALASIVARRVRFARRRGHPAPRARTAAAVHGRGMGARRSRSRSSATSGRSLRARCATADCANSQTLHARSRRRRLPDPNDPATFRAATLDWTRLCQAPHSEWLDYYRELLAIRAREIVPRVPRITECLRRRLGPLLLVRWSAVRRRDARARSEPLRRARALRRRAVPAACCSRRRAPRSTLSPRTTLPPWGVTWRLEQDDESSRC